MKLADPVEATLTYSIVGPPMSVSLGQRAGQSAYQREGVQVGLAERSYRITQGWREWWTLRTGDEWLAVVRGRPSRLRLWLERHAMMLAGASLALLAAELVAAWMMRAGML
ncbi:MAG TPA: hypothetical protein VHA82_12605 [Ramlibacter sp.]|uniref:hypothetical protein n=1 Tax=Ramlibacter sp. TaxID=1917967 RepID=UPI002C288F6C|nr:hypothetical protein [Ramlibacter sp.]HVZ44642.1 hypothetical protein [Ramlibacter sp.]